MSATRIELLRRGTETLQDAGREEPRRTAEWILVDVLSCRRIDLHTEPDAPVDEADADAFAAMIRRRAEGEPLQHVLGHDEFYGLTLRVTPDVLIPRPETEELVERVLDLLDARLTDRSGTSPLVLDVGTGSGCIALALSDQRSDAQVYACDVSPDALRVARENGERLGIDVTWMEADLFAEGFVETVHETVAETASRIPSEATETGLDVLVSNPPYIPDEEAAGLPDVVRDYDPPVALFAGDDPLRFYRRLADVGRSLCRPGGLIAVETHAEYATGVGDVLQSAGWQDVHVERDMSGRPRIAWGRRDEDTG